jgi:DNA-binding CsgD family transcriptional regulator
MLRDSLSLNEIAAQLCVSRNAVKSHTRALYRKLGAASRSEAVRIGRSRGMA